jgi:RND family efflux transporter MFP subunit
VSEVTDLKGELASLKIDRDRPAPSPWRWPLLLFVPVLLGLGLLYALRLRAAFAAPEVETVRPAVVEAAGPAAAGAPILTASGYVVARRKAVVSAKIQGRLAELPVEEGSRVRADEVIARLEDADYVAQVQQREAAVLRAEADLAEQRRQLRLAERLATEEVLAEDQREAAASRVRIAEAVLAQARAELAWANAQLQNTQIRAPFTGVVVKKMAEVGESVAPIPPGVNISTASGAIVALADLATLEVEADVAEANVARLTASQPAEVTVEAFPDRQYRAVLRQVIPDKDEDLKPEMSAKVTFLEKSRPAAAAERSPRQITVPQEAVVTRGGKPTVFEVREDGRVRAQSVVTGPQRQGRVLVREGLTGSETLVARPSDSLKDGDKVRVKR